MKPEEQESEYEFIKRDEEEREIIHVSHKEAAGQFKLKKCTFAVRSELGRKKGAFLGPFPDPGSEYAAELFAVVSSGYEKVPEGFEPSNVMSMRLMEGLYKEVVSYWESFRE